MTNPTGERELIDTLQAERQNWEALLAKVSERRMSWSGASGEWTVKDVVAHLTAWENRVVAWLEAVEKGTWPVPPAWPTNLDEDGTNDWICRANRGRSAPDVLQESRQVFDRLIELIRATSEQDLVTVNRFEWLGGNSLLGAIGGNSFEHYRYHGNLIRAWLDQLWPQAQTGESR